LNSQAQTIQEFTQSINHNFMFFEVIIVRINKPIYIITIKGIEN